MTDICDSCNIIGHTRSTCAVTSSTPTTLNTIEEIIKESVNEHIIKPVQNYIQESGYTFNDFNNINDRNIEIKNISTHTTLDYYDKININKIIGCLSNVFTIIENNKNNITLKYKRVSNYNELDSIDSFINKLRNIGIY